MSLDIHLQCFRNGEPATFKQALAEKIFSRDAIDFRPPLTDVTYADGGAGGIYGADEGDDVQSMMFNHCGGKTFFDALYELARQTKSVIFAATENSPIAITDAETTSHLPRGFTDGLGTPVIVSSGSELAACLYGTD